MFFNYKALKGNKLVQQKIEAESQEEVLNFLKKNGYFPIEIKQAGESNLTFLNQFFDKVSFNDIVDFTRQLSIMLNAGLTLVDSFEILKKQITKSSLLNIVVDIDKEIRGGSSFSKALKKYPQYFSNLYISLVRSGEASGKLSDILLQLSENLEKQREFQGKLKGAMIYPVIVVTAMIGVMFVMVTFVVPKLLGLYKDFDIELPATTKILMAISDVTTKFWPVIIGGTIGLIILVRNYLKTKTGKLMFDQFTLKIPVFKNIVKISALVDSTRTLAILIGSGVSILEGLNIIIETTDNIVFQKAFQNVYKKVEKGVSLGNAMKQEEVFPPILVQMAMVGEQTGHLDDTFARISRYFEMESELAIKTMTTLIEPLILVFLGLGVGFLVMSVITPIYNLTTSFK